MHFTDQQRKKITVQHSENKCSVNSSCKTLLILLTSRKLAELVNALIYCFLFYSIPLFCDCLIMWKFLHLTIICPTSIKQIVNILYIFISIYYTKCFHCNISLWLSMNCFCQCCNPWTAKVWITRPMDSHSSWISNLWVARRHQTTIWIQRLKLVCNPQFAQSMDCYCVWTNKLEIGVTLCLLVLTGH